jgi:hypothetical protein
MNAKFWLENPKGTDHVEDHLGLNGRIILEWMYVRETGWGGVDWFHLAEVKDHWRDFVNTVMNLRIS